MTLRISWSSLRTHSECKNKSHLVRTGHRASLENQRVFFPGTVTDRVVRDWLLLDAPEDSLGLMPEMVDSIIDREIATIAEQGGVMKWKTPGDREQVRADCREAVSKIEPALLKYVLPYEYRPDFSFKAPLKVPHPNGGTEEILLNGFMDIIVRDPKTKQWAVWDVKHTRDNYYWKKTQGQLGFYDLAVQIMFGGDTSVVGLLQPLCNEQVKPITLDADSRSVMLANVVRMAQDVWSKDHTLRQDTKECTYCPVRHACSRFIPVRVGDRHIASFG